MSVRTFKSTVAVRISAKVADRMRRYCSSRGIKQGFFVEKALEEQLAREELAEDLLDFRKNRSQEAAAIGFEEYLRMRNA